MRPTDSLAEGARILTVCNACRYCQGYCPVFPAMERRREFRPADLHQLANLCHNCGECLYACQYAPPHEFAVNVPQVLAEIRRQTYETYAWGGHAKTWLPLIGLAAVVFAPFLPAAPGGNFYGVIPHGVMVGVFGAVAVWLVVALAAGVVRFWNSAPLPGRRGSVSAAARDIFTLRHVGGARRWFHHSTFYGFLLCFASTTVAAFYDSALGWRAPYAYFSLPVVLGTFGGVGLLIGPAGLYWLKQRRDPALVDEKQSPIDLTFLALLFATSLSGLLLLVLRDSRALTPLLVLHLAIVLALFLSLPYGKFVHGFYRVAALLRNAMEERGSGQSHGAGQG